MQIKILAFLVVAIVLLSACQSRTANTFTSDDLTKFSWSEIEQKSRGATVNFAAYAGDENRNRFFQTTVAARLKEKYDISLRMIPLGDTAEAVNKLLNEKGAGKNANGSIDLIWINGENFRTAKKGNLLWGAFADKLPNFALYEKPAGEKDFGTMIDGLETPWQRGQFVLAYDTARLSEPPRTIETLGEFIRRNPGKFAYIAPPDFTGSAFLRHLLYHFGGGAANFQNGFDERLYAEASQKTFAFLNELKPFLWRRGENYPSSPKELDKLFANGEVEFSFNFSPNFATERITRGEFPATVRTFVLAEGTVANYSFLTVPFNAANPAGALVVANYLMSPEHLLAQAQTLGAAYPHDLSKLTVEERAAVSSLPRGIATLSAEELNTHSFPEADSEYLERLEKDWREQVLLK